MRQKVNINNWCNPREINKNFTGVYHDQEKEVAVATDSCILIVSKPDFKKHEVSILVDKKGSEIMSEVAYPKYEIVFRKDVNTFEFDRNKVVELLKKVKDDKEFRQSCLAINIGNKEKPFYVTPNRCRLLASLPDGKFGRGVSYYGGDDILQYESADGNYRVACMPYRVEESVNEDYFCI